MRGTMRVGECAAGRALAAAMVVLIACCAAARAAGPVAMVTDLTGAATSIGGTAEQPVAILNTLLEGDEIRVAGSGRLTLVYLGAGTEHVVAGPGRVRIGKAEPEMLSGAPASSRRLALARETGIVQGAGSNFSQAAIVMRGARKARRITVLGPRGAVLDARPQFRWEAPEPDLRYHFTLEDESGKTILDEQVTGETFQVPADLKLEPDLYYTWRIATTLADGKRLQGVADVNVLPEQERRDIEARMPAAGAPVSERVLYALLLEREGLNNDAHGVWAALLRERPDDAGLKARIGK